MSDRTKVLLAIVCASILWATAGTAKILLRSFDPFTAAFVIYTTFPLIVALAAPKLIGEQVTPKKLAGIILGLVGAVLVTILPVMERGQLSSGDLGGNLFVLIAILCWSGYTITSRSILTAKQSTAIRTNRL